MERAVRFKSAADYATSEIQRMILAGELPAGERLDQVRLAEQLDVSRHPVRQAIERLAELIRKAEPAPVKRKPTRPTRAAKEKRLESKARRSTVKSLRGKPFE